MPSVVDHETWSKLHKSNLADRFAIEAMDTLLAIEDNYNEFNQEIIKLIEHFELPCSGSCGHICEIVKDLKELAEDLYVLVYDGCNVEDMSSDVFAAFSDSSYAITNDRKNA